MNKNEAMECLFCGGRLIWDSDANIEDVHSMAEEGDGGVASYYTCSRCGRSYEICDPIKEERETAYREYWDNCK
jgi:DNA-directed RNA polymerase subunit RPC12/RpoP